jgi:hypothetical protein
VTATRKLLLTVGLFAAALLLVGLAAATKVVGPLFGAWAPLLLVPYVLTRPEPGVDDMALPESGQPDGGSEAPSRGAEPGGDEEAVPEG